MSTAVECVREIFPEAAIQTKRIENPFRVTIAVQLGDNKQQPIIRIWTAKQHNLFQRNPKRRRLAMDSMKQALARFKEQVLSGSHPETAPSTSTASVTSSAAPQISTTVNNKPEPEKQASLISL